MTKKQEKIKYYMVKVRCRNCSYGNSYERTMNIAKGTRAGTEVDMTPCPNCGCYTLQNL
jgi:Zn finger protein HypA/HybF involved in hydrogenase expression